MSGKTIQVNNTDAHVLWGEQVGGAVHQIPGKAHRTGHRVRLGQGGLQARSTGEIEGKGYPGKRRDNRFDSASSASINKRQSLINRGGNTSWPKQGERAHGVLKDVDVQPVPPSGVPAKVGLGQPRRAAAVDAFPVLVHPPAHLRQHGQGLGGEAALGMAFADLGPDPELPDPIDTVLEIRLRPGFGPSTGPSPPARPGTGRGSGPGHRAPR